VADKNFTLTLNLLWGRRDPPTRGPKPGLTTDQIVRTAIELADQEGLEALSMRKVAERLGAGAMSLYRYVPGKAELLQLMLDAIHGEDADPPPLGTWRERLEGLARRSRARILRHPWMLQVVLGRRPPLGPNVLADWDLYLGALSDIGLAPVEVSPAAELVAGYVQGATRLAVEAEQVERESGQTDAQWWSTRMSFWEEYFDPERFPAITKIYAQGGYDKPIDSFEFGLQRILDGIAARLA
jgi:AcrR family transcriptional regulator